MTCDFEMDRSIGYECCSTDYANGGVLEVKEELQRELEEIQLDVGYFGQFRRRLKNEKRI